MMHEQKNLMIAQNGQLDICMPEMDGYTFMRMIKEKPDLRDIPIICLTADASEHSLIRPLPQLCYRL